MFSANSKQIIRYSFPLIINSLINTVYGLLLINGYSHLDDSITVIILAINSINFLILGSLGYLSSAIQIEYNNYNDKNKLISTSYFSAICVWLILFIIVIIFGNEFNSSYYGFSGMQLSNSYIYLVFTSISSLLTLFTFVTNAILKVNEKTAILGKANLVASIISFTTFIIVLVVGPSIIYISLWSLVYSFVCLVISYLYMLKVIGFKVTSIDVKLIKKLLKSTSVMGIQELFDTTIILLFLETILANYDQSFYQSYLINMQLLNYLMIPIYMVSSSLYTYIKNIDSDNLYFNSAIKINMSMYITGVVMLIIVMTPLYNILVSDEIGIQLFIFSFILLFGSNIMLPSYITYRTLLQCYGLAERIVVPTIIINLITVICLVIINQIFIVPIYFYFIIVGLNYLLLTAISYLLLKQRYLQREYIN